MKSQWEIDKKKDIQCLYGVGKEYIKHLNRLIKALSIVRTEAHYLNLLTKKDREISSKYKLPGFWGMKTTMVINGYDLSEFSNAALLHLAEHLPESYKASGVNLDILPDSLPK